MENENYRTTLWTGDHFQITLMAIPAGGGDIGMEIHHGNDQLIYLVAGIGHVKMGKDKDHLTVDQEIHPGEAVVVPDNTWHNVINAGKQTMKVFSIYSPVKHQKELMKPLKPMQLSRRALWRVLVNKTNYLSKDMIYVKN